MKRSHKMKMIAVLMMAILAMMMLGACAGETTEEEAPAYDGVQYSIAKVEGEPDWSTVEELSLDNIQWEPDRGVRAYGQFCYDADYLYVHLRAVEENIKAEYIEPLSPVYKDSCLEFFFMPEDGDRYFNFEINPNGCLWVGFGHGRDDSTVLYRPDFTEMFDIRSGRTEDGWEVWYRIPADYIGLFYPGYEFTGALRANVYKCGDETDHPHYLTWSKVESEKPDYHRPEFFGRMEFEE